ncbi:hypothetical protein LZ016_04595 [Sphingomonas sp. SM33]|uniref:Uncharacterized protein n=1 Tax=Sphingomonas telluris TaxID=2907998 RepID=A0ABS9VK80_9SPHN|nr:hypothetical protein [Sphingomonas telluris]MCH8615380.1 hypothetical protein [Sphingomonas telluris]
MDSSSNSSANKALEWGILGVIVVGMIISTAALYLMILTIVGSAIALAATFLGDTLAASIHQHGVRPSVQVSYLQLIIYASAPEIIVVTLTLASLGKDKRELLRVAVDQGSDWLVRFGELLLLACVFQYAAQKIQFWAIQALAFLMFLCLAWHAMKPIWALARWPDTQAPAKKRNRVLMLASFAFIIALTFITFLSLNSGLTALIDAGVVSP